MPRARWCATHSVLCLLIGACSFWIVTVDADCWYDEDRHEEGAEVATAEPCLNCSCNRGALLCYLRVCPKLPNPPPPGCILLHRYRTCCPELICSEFPGGGNELEARSDPDDTPNLLPDRALLGNACFLNGSIYGPGSAMHSSSLCEYCYCLGGKQTCVKPKCLLPIEGCVPVYDPTNCCPVQYNCSSQREAVSTTSSTTTVEPKESIIKDKGCMVDGIHHPEGEKVLGVGHSVCDNCYCMKGLLRCEPLSCAPPLLGCVPVIKSGQCCAASYNCSGTIEIQPEPNYGHFPIVSKEYAKLRKEVNQINPPNRGGVVTVAPVYVLAESAPPSTTKHRTAGTFGTTRHFTGVSVNPSTAKPFYYNSMNEKQNSEKYSTRNHADYKESFPGVYYATTNYEFQNTNYKRVYSTTNKPAKPTESSTLKTVNAITTADYKEERTKSSDYSNFVDENLFSIFESFLDGRLDRKVGNESKNTSTTENYVTTEVYNTTSEGTTLEHTSTVQYLDDSQTDMFAQSTDSEQSTTTQFFTDTTTDLVFYKSYPVTLKTVLNSTDCIKDNSATLLESNNFELTTVLPVNVNEINKLADVRVTNSDLVSTTSSEESNDSTTEEDITEVDLISKASVGNAALRDVPNIPNLRPDIKAILNITKQKVADYDYDYNEPSLPPSLPNVRIIPFVAADALDVKKDSAKDNKVYAQEKATDTAFVYTNLFSPPVETEGGFVPKDPPLLDNFYENAVTVPSITVAPEPISSDCVDQNGREVVHGQSVSSDSPCVTCTCFYGNIVCQKPTCPLPGSGCRKAPVQDLTLCCPHYLCDGEAPTVVLDRIDGAPDVQEGVSLVERVITPDPFRDVIRTEPAPNLQSLIGDMRPFITRKTTTPIPLFSTESLSVRENATSTTYKSDIQPDEELSLDKVLELLFSGNNENNVETQANKIQTTIDSKPAGVASTVSTATAPPIYQKPNLTQTTTENAQRRQSVNEGDSNSNSNHPNNVDSTGVGLLKLAGCNIYGRMYRVGRIISELSGPCLECKCTEVGVQCRALKC